MADYWKSQAKKFCEFCKCWIADNKPSVEFHEKGKRHKENVTKRLAEIGKKSQKEHQNNLRIDDEMKKMEEAALKAYMKDVEANPDFTSQLLKEKIAQREAKESNVDVKTEPESEESPIKQKKVSQNKEEESKVAVKKEPKSGEVQVKTEPTKLWYEAQSDDGYTYYWHIETGESKWEPPDEGYMTIVEQKEAEKKEHKKLEEEKRKRKLEEERLKEEERARLEREKMKSRRVKEEEEKPAEYPMPILGPAPKPDPYGTWKLVEHSIPEPVDLQLPEQEFVEIKVPIAAEPQVKFKEKTVTSLVGVEGDSGSGFRKRKFNVNPKRNMRQRLDDD